MVDQSTGEAPMNWLSRWLRRRDRDHGSSRARVFQPRTMVEGLEERALLSGALTRFPAPELNGIVTLVAGPDGNVWFLATVTDHTSLTTSNSVDRITPDGRISTVAPILGDTLIIYLT